MKKNKGLKCILFVMLIMCAIICMKDFVSAESSSKEEDNSFIAVYVDGIRYAFEDGDPDYSFDALPTVSYDKENRVLTLNNFKGDRVNAWVDTEYSTKKLTVKLIGKNSIERRLGDRVRESLIEFTTFDKKTLDVDFVGNGTLDFYSRNQPYDVLEVYNCNVTINGPVLNFIDCNSGKGTYPVRVREFVMNSGTVNMEIWPKYHNVKEGDNYLSYGYAVRAFNKIDVAGGKMNISYKFPRDDYNNEDIEYTEGIALGCWLEEPKTTNVNLSLDKEIEGKIKLIYEHKITVKCVKESEGYYGTVYDDVNLVPGITWDEKTKTLTLAGYNEGQVKIESEKYIEKVKVIIKNNNNMKYASHYTVADVVSGGFNTKNVDLEFIGDGSLTVDGPLRMESNYISGFGNVSYDPVTLIVDGPHLEFNGVSSINNFIMKSGKLIVKVCGNSYGMNVYDSFFVYGGTLIGRMEDKFYNGDGKDRFIELEEGCIGKVENCVIACTGYVDRVEENDLAICTRIDGEYCKPINVKFNNVLTFYGSSISEIPPTDINRYKANISANEYVYTGKRIEPKVKVGGLIEGEDYTVTYANNINIGKADITVCGVGLYKGIIKLNFDIVKGKPVNNKNADKANNKSENKSDVFKYKKLLYRVVSEAKSGSKYGKVELVGSVNKKCKKITIPKVVKINNKKYRVVSIAKKAFADCKKLKKVVIKSKSIKKIGKKSFAGKKKITVKVPKKKKKAYRELLKKAKIKVKVL